MKIFQVGLAPRVSALYGVNFAGTGLFLPFFPVILANRSYSVTEVSLALALGTYAKIAASPFLTGFSDKTGFRRLSICFYSLLGMMFLALFAFTSSYLFAVIAVMGLMVCWAPIVPLADGYALDVVRQTGAPYGRMRLWGSAAFVMGTVLAGWLMVPDTEMPYLAGILGSMVATVFVAGTLPPMRNPEREAWEAAGAEQVAAGRPAVFREPWFLALVTLIGLSQAAHSAYYAFSTIYWTKTGVPEHLMGPLWSVGVTAEILLFLFAARLPAWLTPMRLIIMGTAGASLRWFLFTHVNEPVFIVMMQTLHALSFGAVHLGGVALIAQAVPMRWSATGQSLMATSTGFLTATATWFSGPLYAAKPAYAFYAMSAMAALAFVCLLLLARHPGFRARTAG
jgi:PPP family 3-phenylpropionic acid transporter